MDEVRARGNLRDYSWGFTAGDQGLDVGDSLGACYLSGFFDDSEGGIGGEDVIKPEILSRVCDKVEVVDLRSDIDVVLHTTEGE